MNESLKIERPSQFATFGARCVVGDGRSPRGSIFQHIAAVFITCTAFSQFAVETTKDNV